MRISAREADRYIDAGQILKWNMSGQRKLCQAITEAGPKRLERRRPLP